MGWKPFPYLPLSGTQIRYITAHPSNGATGKVRCTLHQAPLEDVDFDALSYAWGVASVTETIILSGKPFRATTNLVACLKQLATRSADTILWVDAICINQNDVEERNIQVQRMKNIYSAASSIIAWVGPSTKLSHIGVERLKNINPSDAKVLRYSREEQHIKDRTRILRSLLNGEGEHGLRDLLTRPFWYRTWIIQEIVLGGVVQKDRSRPICLLCGEDEIPFYTLWDLTILLNDHHRIDCEQTTATTKESLIDWRNLFTEFFYDVQGGALRLISTIQKPIWTLQELLSFFTSFQCSDDRDKIYALLGISSDAEGISPDYNKSTTMVYSEAVRWLIEKHNSLDVLSMACYHGERDFSHASWIPDWRVGAPDAHAFADKLMYNGQYFSSKGLPVSSHPWSLSTKAERLHLTGACLDTITSLSTAITPNNKGLAEVQFNIIEWMKMVHQRLGEGALETTLFLGLPGGRYPFNENEPISEACRRTLVADCADLGVDTDSPHMLVFPWDKSQQGSECSTHTAASTSEAYKTLLVRRRLAITSKGWIGMVQKEAEVGDHVAVLIGASVPFILRKARGGMADSHDNEYTLIGDAYIHGLMHGKGRIWQSWVTSFCAKPASGTRHDRDPNRNRSSWQLEECLFVKRTARVPHVLLKSRCVKEIDAGKAAVMSFPFASSIYTVVCTI